MSDNKLFLPNLLSNIDFALSLPAATCLLAIAFLAASTLSNDLPLVLLEDCSSS